MAIVASPWETRRPTRVRKFLDQMERIRYALAYRKTLKSDLRLNPDILRYRIGREQGREIRSFWRGHGVNYVNLDWYKFQGGLLGKVDPRFIPEETFRIEIEPHLNSRGLAGAYEDKNLIDMRFADFRRPVTVLRNMHGIYYDAAYQPLNRPDALAVLKRLDGAYIVKPCLGDTGGGQNVNRITISNGTIQADDRAIGIADIERTYKTNFIFQEVVEQHPEMAIYHPKSLNTCRIMTLRLDGAYHVIAGVLRMGNGKYTDNLCSGGLSAGIDINTAVLTPFALDGHYRKFTCHPASNVVFQGRTVPMLDQIKSLALSVHARLSYFDMVSHDIALCQDGQPCLIEVNLFGQAIQAFQILKGSPIFGEHTDRVLEMVDRRRQGAWING